MTLELEYQQLDYLQIDDSGNVEFRWERLWANQGHWHGDGMLSPDEKWFYLNIPKNSSSSIKKTLTDLEWTFGDIKDYPDAGKIIVLRDPISRWISGMSEYLMMYHQDCIDSIISPMDFDCMPLLGEKLGLSLLFENMSFDDHTDRQAAFLIGIDTTTTDCHWFFIDQDFDKKFIDFLTTIGYPSAVSYKENSTDSDSYEFNKKRKLQDLLKYIIYQKPYLRHKLERWFWPDYALIESKINSVTR